MRVGLVIAFLLTLPAAARAQEQESKLVDRLLRPNTELQNDSQSKKFQSARVVEGKPANIRAFYLQDRQLAKNFTAIKNVQTRAASSRDFPASAAYIGSRNVLTKNKFSTGTSPLIRTVPDADKKVAQREFGTTNFEARGKSQKALSTQNRAMTIDEVRELLNKSK